MIAHIKTPSHPDFHFEYHEQTGKVYLVDLLRAPRRGQVIAEHCDTHGRAIGFVQTYLRGYKKHEQDTQADAAQGRAGSGEGAATG